MRVSVSSRVDWFTRTPAERTPRAPPRARLARPPSRAPPSGSPLAPSYASPCHRRWSGRGARRRRQSWRGEGARRTRRRREPPFASSSRRGNGTPWSRRTGTRTRTAKNRRRNTRSWSIARRRERRRDVWSCETWWFGAGSVGRDGWRCWIRAFYPETLIGTGRVGRERRWRDAHLRASRAATGEQMSWEATSCMLRCAEGECDVRGRARVVARQGSDSAECVRPRRAPSRAASRPSPTRCRLF